jgi:hypothetical protein
VTFQPAPGESVLINCSTVNCISVSADYVTVRDMRTAFGTSPGGK